MDIISRINGIIWGDFTVAAIFAAGIYLTIKNRFIQFRFIPLLKSSSGDSRSRTRAVTAALAASLGTGNITGCAAALAIGGPGAVFWMWVSAFTGMAVSYAENRIGMEYRRRYPGSSAFGPMLYMEKCGRGWKTAALIYAAACTGVSFTMGNMSQSGAFSEAVCTACSGGMPFRAAVSAGMAVLTAWVLFSGESGSSAVMSLTEKAVPVMGLFYLGGALLLLPLTGADVTGAFREIISSAFGVKAAVGGIGGYAVRTVISTGMRRGVFSNEAGMGSSVIVHSAAGFESPESAGAWAAFEVFLDTIVCCTVTALAVICCGGGTDPYQALSSAFSLGFGRFGEVFTAVSVCLFAYAAVLGWSCYGEMCVKYIGERLFPENQRLVRIMGAAFRGMYCLAVFFGGILPESFALETADLFNCFVMLPNLAAVVYIAATDGSD
ncbi:MAG: alanine/glycine:cation symporter family protein [Huintestinicola sp.]